MLDNQSDKFCFLCFRCFFFLSRFFLIDLLECISFDKLFLFDDESGDGGSGSGSPGTCAFTFCSDKSVGCVYKYFGTVRGVGSGILVLTGIKSIGDVVPLVVFAPKGVESKGGRLIKIFLRTIS